jgi:hypothetical protein
LFGRWFYDGWLQAWADSRRGDEEPGGGEPGGGEPGGGEPGGGEPGGGGDDEQRPGGQSTPPG